MTTEPIGYVFPGTPPFPIIPVPLLTGTWIGVGTFQFNLAALPNGVVPAAVVTIPFNPAFIGQQLFSTALMASTYSNSLRIANVTEIQLL